MVDKTYSGSVSVYNHSKDIFDERLNTYHWLFIVAGIGQRRLSLRLKDELDDKPYAFHMSAGCKYFGRKSRLPGSLRPWW